MSTRVEYETRCDCCGVIVAVSTYDTRGSTPLPALPPPQHFMFGSAGIQYDLCNTCSAETAVTINALFAAQHPRV